MDSAVDRLSVAGMVRHEWRDPMRYLIPLALLLVACGDCPEPETVKWCEAVIPVDMTTHLGSAVVECEIVHPGICVYDGMTYPCEGSGLQ